MRWPPPTTSCRRRAGRAPTSPRSSTRRWRPIAPITASASMTGGPPAMLLPATAQAVALALHELATNAAKYGALSTDTGHLRLVWTIDDRGAGRRLDRDRRPGRFRAASRWASACRSCAPRIEAQFRGGVLYEWRPEGLHCRCRSRAPRSSAPNARRRACRRTAGASGRVAGARSLAGERLLMVEDEAAGRHDGQAHPGRSRRHRPRPLRRSGRRPGGGRSERFDGALLDFNLAGELADPLADLLIARGVPFVFITGYQRDSIDRRYANVPVLPKPIEADTLERVLVSLLEPPSRRAAEG